MWQLKNKGLIDHLTVAFFIENGDTDLEEPKSVIKFGGMDKQGIQDDTKYEGGKSKLRLMRTKNKTTWDIDLEWIKTSAEVTANEFTLRLEP